MRTSKRVPGRHMCFFCGRVLEIVKGALVWAECEVDGNPVKGHKSCAKRAVEDVDKLGLGRTVIINGKAGGILKSKEEK